MLTIIALAVRLADHLKTKFNTDGLSAGLH